MSKGKQKAHSRIVQQCYVNERAEGALKDWSTRGLAFSVYER